MLPMSGQGGVLVSTSHSYVLLILAALITVTLDAKECEY